MRVLALMKYGSRAASARQRLLQFKPYLAEHGVEVELRELLDDEHVRRIASGQRADALGTLASYARRLGQLLSRHDHDVLWVQYELFPYLPAPFERLAALAGKPIVVDYDDAIFHMYDAHPSPLVRLLLGRKLVPLLRGASACICGNEYLRAYAARHCDTCVTIPTVVDTSRYVPSNPQLSRPTLPVIGWIGSAATWPYVEPILPLLEERVARGEASVRVVGGGPASTKHPWLESIPWSEATEISDVQSMDIGIMPTPDDRWARGKCGYKLIQYMACGLPVVASPVGVNIEIVAEGENGYLASSVEAWATSLDRLLADVELRRRLGQHGRERAVERYSLSSQAPRLLHVLRAADTGRHVAARG